MDVVNAIVVTSHEETGYPTKMDFTTSSQQGIFCTSKWWAGENNGRRWIKVSHISFSETNQENKQKIED